MIQRLLLVVLLTAVPSLTAAQVIVDTIHGRTITIKVVPLAPPPADTPLVHQLRPGHPLLVELTSRARRVVPDTVWVYSDIDGTNWPYAGEPLDTVFEGLFTPFYPSLTYPHSEPELFATRRFVLDPQHVGYLLRVPGMYESTALDLWIYDARAMRFGVPERLAESWEDEGCGYDLESLLIRSAADGQLTLLTVQNRGCSDMETGKVLSNSDSLWIRPWTGTAFSAQQLSTDSTLISLFRRQREHPTALNVCRHCHVPEADGARRLL